MHFSDEIQSFCAAAYVSTASITRSTFPLMISAGGIRNEERTEIDHQHSALLGQRFEHLIADVALISWR